MGIVVKLSELIHKRQPVGKHPQVDDVPIVIDLEDV
jgi:hypothetical protein